jgi:hypothetical protein
MFPIRAEHIYVLRNSTGKPFTDLMDRLIRSSATILGIPPSAISDNPRTNVADGGVDTEVSGVAPSDPWNYFTIQSAWQYKAVATVSLTDDKLAEEIEGKSKTYIRELLQKGYGYRMCIADDATAQRKREMEAVLNTAIRKIKPDAPDCIVLFAGEIITWANAFPSIVAEMTGSDLGGFFHFQTWGENARSSTRTFVQTPESALIRDSVHKHLDWSKPPISTRLTISGDAGVGKTRTVFEAISELEGIRSLTFYTDDEDNALELATKIANHVDMYAVIVADECLDAAAFRIGQALQGCKGRVRLITIDNALERTDRTELQLARISTGALQEILQANFPQIEQTRLYRYCNLADGSLRFAISLCVNDDLILQQGHLGHFLSDTKSYLGTLFGNGGPFDASDQAALDLIALVERCGVVRNVEGELTQLCELTGLDTADVKTRLHRMQKTNGLVGRAGRYFYVTPTPIAMVCFQSAWSRWAELDTKSFLERFPRDLTSSFLSRVSRASKEVGQVVTAYFRNWMLSRGGDIFADQSDTQQLLLLVQADPDRMIPLLHSLVLSTTTEQLAAGYRSGRRALVTEALEIARFPEWFSQAEDILFRLALHETEPNLGNNATELWKSLFPIMNPVVATPFQDRFDILMRRRKDSDPKVRGLCVKALRDATDERSIYMTGSSIFGRRVPPTPWRPKTWDEYFFYVQSCISMLNELCADDDADVRMQAAKAFVGSVRYAVSSGILEATKAGAGVVPKQIRPVLRSELRELLLLGPSPSRDETEEQKSRKTLFIEGWIVELAPTDLHDQLVEDVGSDTWSHNLEQEAWEERIAALAKRLFDEPDALSHELPWLNSKDASSAAELGLQVGRLDTCLSHLQPVLSECRANRADRFAQGYFEGVSEAARQLSSDTSEAIRFKLNAAIDEIWQADPILAFSVMLPSGDFLSSFNRAIAGVREKQIPASLLRAFAAWNGRRHTSPLEARMATETLLECARSGDVHAAATGLDFIQFLLMRHQEEPKTQFLATLFEDENLDTFFGLLELAVTPSRQFPHSFTRIFARALPANPSRAARLVVEMMKSDDYDVSNAGSGLLHSVALLEAPALMEAIGEAMLDRDRNINFLVKKFPITALPTEVIIDWIKRNGVEGARILTRHLPGPFVGSDGPGLHPATSFIMEAYGEDDGVFSSFAAGIHSGGVFAGPISNWAQGRVSLAEQFINYPIESVRRWARGEVQFSSEQVVKFREHEEEEGF